MKKTRNNWPPLSVLGVRRKTAEAHIIQIDGSSTVFPITDAASEEFQKAKKGAVKVAVGIAGTFSIMNLPAVR